MANNAKNEFNLRSPVKLQHQTNGKKHFEWPNLML